MTDEEKKARLVALLEHHPADTRHSRLRREVQWALVVVALTSVAFILMGGPASSSARGPGFTAAIAGGWAVFSALMAYLVLARGKTLGASPWVLALVAGAMPFAAYFWLTAFNGHYLEPWSRVGWRCLSFSVILSVTPLAGFVVLRRGSEPRSPWLLGAAAGAVSGAWAGIFVDQWCPLVNPSHVLFGHVLPVVIAIFAGTVLGGWLLRLRSV